MIDWQAKVLGTNAGQHGYGIPTASTSHDRRGFLTARYNSDSVVRTAYPQAIRRGVATTAQSRRKAAGSLNFNASVARYESALRAVSRRLWLQPKWLRYQIRRSRESYVPALRREPSRKTAAQIGREMAAMTLAWRCLPFHYLRYGLFRSAVTTEQAMSFLPETVMYYSVLPRINEMSALLDDKLTFKQILAADGIPHPRTIMAIRRGRVYCEGQPVAADATAEVLGQDSATRVVVKPARFGSGGGGIYIFSRAGNDYTDGERWLSSTVPELAALGDWVVEEHLKQTDEVAAPHPWSTNTLRVMTWCHRDEEPEVLYTMLKTGAGGRPTDNAHTDGLYVRVHPDGALDPTAWDEQLQAHTRHPDTGFVFGSGKLPSIDEVRATAIRCAYSFPEVTFAGWDIALTPSGPVVIEGNSSPGLTIIQRTHGGMAPTVLRCLSLR